MKKLMITAAAVAMTAGAFAAPAVYDFKASVKHMYLKEVRVNTRAFQGTVYQKYQKSASLKGYLVQDMDGFTSPTITAGSTAQCLDVGRSRAFLVVQNSSAERDVRAPKVLPAVLDAKYFDTKFTAATPATTGLAEGYLFVGGDSILSIRPVMDGDGRTPSVARGALLPAPAATVPGAVAYSDYVWTSLYLFGQYNGPNWFKTPTPSVPFPAFEAAWDANLCALPAAGAAPFNTGNGVQRGVDGTGGLDSDGDAVIDLWNYYHDTWMNGSGIGKYFVPDDTGDLCCGLLRTTYLKTLESLSGNLKGGIFLCTENGIDANSAGYAFWDGDLNRWDDQFVSNRINPSPTWAGDAWQNDIWLDGSVDQNTTDVVYGTWSIKFNRTFVTTRGLLGQYQAAVLAGTAPAAPWANDCGEAVCAAAWAVNRNVRMYNGSEIYMATSNNRFRIPFITPQFIAYYGL